MMAMCAFWGGFLLFSLPICKINLEMEYIVIFDGLICRSITSIVGSDSSELEQLRVKIFFFFINNKYYTHFDCTWRLQSGLQLWIWIFLLIFSVGIFSKRSLRIWLFSFKINLSGFFPYNSQFLSQLFTKIHAFHPNNMKIESDCWVWL